MRIVHSICLLLMLASAGSALAQEENLVSIANKGRYFEVELNVPPGTDGHRKLGKAYGNELKKVPNYERTIDSYLKFVVSQANMPKQTFGLLRRRALEIKPQLPEKFQAELEGISSVLDGHNNLESEPGDGVISPDEFLMLNLLPDIARPTQCSAVSCFASSSADGETHVCRNLDWYAGDQQQILDLHAVIHFKEDGRHLISIGFLGCQGIISGFNDHGVFASILDSPTGALYSATSKRSYYVDLRSALESEATAEAVAVAMKKRATDSYTFNHLVLAADKDKCLVLENNFSGFRLNQTKRFKPDIRYSDSKLHKGMTWPFKDSIGTVNTFLLSSHFDNHNYNFTHDIVETGAVSLRDEGGNPHNVKRWKNMKKQLSKVLKNGRKANLEDMKRIMSFFTCKEPSTAEKGDLMTERTLQSIACDPRSRTLQIYFRKRGDETSFPYLQVKSF